MNCKLTAYKGWCGYCKCIRLFYWHGNCTGADCRYCGGKLKNIKQDNGQQKLI